ncbi:musculoskeletal embryonic nuclear protein 1b isoform X4 [Entelurus aequoreus]|uniref:musculoskeletal embryonic nuclear protein 1b isoform X4 n=1 Tax=Entelurus aequoreus TaxID=161455 RepID=UPI002B1D422F|nr:musculoskeletal embryonic nuclear protein 1b isoform X4 [Entelurus aequoreus]
MSQKRTYPSGAEKRKKKKVEEEKKCHDKGALLKYFGGTESAQSQSTSSGSTVSDESVLSHTPPSSVPTVPSMSETTADLSTTSTTTSPSHHGPSSAPPVDPAEWPSFLSDSDRTEQQTSRLDRKLPPASQVQFQVFIVANRRAGSERSLPPPVGDASQASTDGPKRGGGLTP